MYLSYSPSVSLPHYMPAPFLSHALSLCLSVCPSPSLSLTHARTQTPTPSPSLNNGYQALLGCEIAWLSPGGDYAWHSVHYGRDPAGHSADHHLKAWGEDISNIQNHAERQGGWLRNKPLKMDGQHCGFLIVLYSITLYTTTVKGRRVIHFARCSRGRSLILCRAGLHSKCWLWRDSGGNGVAWTIK